MRIAEGFKLRTLVNEKIVVSESVKRVNFNKIIQLNESAAYLWESVIGKDFDAKDLAQLLLDKYDIDEDTASRDAQTLASKWIEAGLVEE